MGKLTYVIKNKNDINPTINKVVDMVGKALYRGPVVIVLGRLCRTLAQNAKMWPMLKDWSKQVRNKDGNMYIAMDWKTILTGSFKGEVRYAVALDGQSLISLGLSTRRLSKKKFSEFIEFIYAEGSRRGIEWSEKSQEVYKGVKK